MIKIEELYFSYGKVNVYRNFNLHIPGDQVCLITGISGVGKSTLLRLMAGVLQPDSGRIIYNPKLGAVPKKKIGFISDKLSLYESLTVKHGIELHLAMFGLRHFDDSIIKFTKIRMDQRIKELSIGQRTIFHLSLILSTEPEVLLIDEIIHAIDAYLRNLFLQTISQFLSKRKFTVVMVNVNFHDIEHLINRVIMLRDGEIAVDEEIGTLKQKVKKVITGQIPNGIPVLSQLTFGSQKEYFVYPYQPELESKIGGEIIDLNLADIIAAFIGREYD